jgi:hypothetical protein
MSVTSLEELYIGYFGRAADPAGLNYWLTQEAAGVSDVQIAAAFAASAEALALYPQLGTPILLESSTAAQLNFLNAVYQNLFGHAADSAGATYWEGMLSAGVNPGVIINQIINGALGTDAAAIAAKAGVAASYTNAVLTAVPAITYSKNDASQSKTILATVTNASTAAATGPAISAAISADQSGNTGVVGATLTLGTGGQVFSPTQTGGFQTTGGNVIRGVSAFSSYLSTTDSITGAGGFNTINSVLDGDSDDGIIVNPVLVGIQAVNVAPGQANQTFSLASSTGVQTLSVAGGIFPSDFEATGTTLFVVGATTATAMGMMNAANTIDNLTASFGGLSATATNTESLVLSGNAGGTFDSTVSSSTGVGINQLNVTSTGKANTVTIGTTDTALSSIVVSGSANLTMVESNTGVATINGSAATGNLNITASPTVKATVTGGSGNDTLSLQGATKSVSITDGAGTDTMIVNGNVAANVITAGSGIDTVQFLPSIGTGGLNFISAADTASNATLTGDLNVLNNYIAGNTKIDLHGIASNSLDTGINPTSLANALSAAQSLLQALNSVASLVTSQPTTLGNPVVAFAFGGNEYVFQDNQPTVASLAAADGVLQVTGAAATFKTSDINFA